MLGVHCVLCDFLSTHNIYLLDCNYMCMGIPPSSFADLGIHSFSTLPLCINSRTVHNAYLHFGFLNFYSKLEKISEIPILFLLRNLEIRNLNVT
jgi:hypothetical protein